MYAVILAGGSGTRLWPLSRELFPKYHLEVVPDIKGSLFEQTIYRVNSVIDDNNIIVVTHESQKNDIETVLGRNKKENITVIGEPEAKNTAPAIGLIAWYLHKKDPEAVMAVLPSDHYLEPEKEFADLLKDGEKTATKHGLVTFGIRPNIPETGYGYILCGEELDQSAYRVKQFVEKPDLSTAEKFLNDGRYLWNSGMFSFKVSSLIEDFRKHLPEMSSLIDKIDLDSMSNLSEIYNKMESISIDYGIMEKAEKVAVIPTNIKWNDVGSWNSYHEMSKLDSNNNSLQGKVIDIGSRDSLVISPHRVTGTIGLNNLIIVDTPDALLVCDRNKTQDVKKIVEELKKDNAEEAVVHTTVYRPWGSYTVLKEADTFKVKTITVNPGERLSLQRHQYRSENWTVVRGTARITKDEEIHTLKPGESIYLPAKCLHRLQNEGSEIVEIVEVQNGSYLGEDDIERISDDYNRAGDSKDKHSNKDSNAMVNYKMWLDQESLSDEDKNELIHMSDNKQEIEKRFSHYLRFGTGGLRGIIGTGTNRINKYVVRRATQGLADYINNKYSKENEKKAVIAYDSRHLSPELAKETALVFCANNIKAYIFNNLRPVPELSFAIRELDAKVGVMITASHNPPEYNGYKVYNNHGGQAVPSETDEIIKFIDQVDFFDGVNFMDEEKAIRDNLLCTIEEDIDRKYLDAVKSLCYFEGNKDIKVIYSPLHGTGYPLIPRVLKELGYNNIQLVEDQIEPDPQFSTVKSPNPEEREAFTLALEIAKSQNAEIVLGTDPDCDRVGCAVKNNKGDYILLNGNQIGALLVNYILNNMKEKNILPTNGIVIKTIVTGNLGKIIAANYGIDCEETLTGFKFIGDKIREYEENGDKEFLFGYEESFGYLAGTFVRDKDAVISSTLIVEMAAHYREQNLSLLDVLDSLQQEFGYFLEELQSVELSHPSEASRVVKILAEKNVLEIAGQRVKEKINYISGKIIDPHTKNERSIQLPKTDAIQIQLEDGSWFCVRPSGTEPKFKIYYSAVGKTFDEVSSKIDLLKSDVKKILL